MAVRSSRLHLCVLLFVALLVATGCNPFTMPAFLAGEGSEDPSFHPITKSNQPSRVVVLAHAPSTNNDPESAGCEYELSSKLTRQILRNSKESEDQIELIPPRQVDAFKNDHSNWYTMDLRDIGTFFKADYVIFLDVVNFDLYENDSGKLMLRGRTAINVQLLDMHGREMEADQKVYKCEYPRGHPIPSDDTPISAFRDKFLDQITLKLSWYFTKHSVSNEFHDD